MDKAVYTAIEAILKRGNNVEIRRKGDGYIVLEVKKTIQYSASRIGAGQGQSEPTDG